MGAVPAALIEPSTTPRLRFRGTVARMRMINLRSAVGAAARSSSLDLAIACSLVLATACGGKSPPPSSGPAPTPSPGGSAAECKKTGCSGSLCSDEDVMSTCEFKPEYACYQSATCARQPDGKCGWTETPELTACLASPPPAQ